MMRTLALMGLLAWLAAAATAQAQPRERREGDLKVGAAAPEFTVYDMDGNNPVKLSVLNDRPVVLLFGSCT